MPGGQSVAKPFRGAVTCVSFPTGGEPTSARYLARTCHHEAGTGVDGCGTPTATGRAAVARPHDPAPWGRAHERKTMATAKKPATKSAAPKAGAKKTGAKKGAKKR